MTIECIIARCNENTAWTHKIKHKCTIYDKSDIVVKNSVPRPNIGRESETYLDHILQNYENLSDITIFMQGDPFDCMYDLRMRHPFSIKEIYYAISQINNINSDAKFGGLFQQPHNIPDKTNGCPIKQKYCEIFETPVCDFTQFTVIMGAQYIVPKKNILQKPKHFWEKLYNMVKNDHPKGYDIGITTKGFICGYTLECLWYYIFNENMELYAFDYVNLMKFYKTILPQDQIIKKTSVNICKPYNTVLKKYRSKTFEIMDKSANIICRFFKSRFHYKT
jgi:hypothetical protein